MKILLLVVFSFALIESKTLEDDVEKMEVKAYEPFSIQLNDNPSAAFFWNIVEENKLDGSVRPSQ